MKIEIKISPEEFRGILSVELQKTFDGLVVSMTDQGIDKTVAQAMIAKSFLEYLKGQK